MTLVLVGDTLWLIVDLGGTEYVVLSPRCAALRSEPAAQPSPYVGGSVADRRNAARAGHPSTAVECRTRYALPWLPMAARGSPTTSTTTADPAAESSRRRGALPRRAREAHAACGGG